MELPLPAKEVFPFFADAENLESITPPELGFSILTPRPITLNADALIDYRLRLMGIPLLWRSRISLWDPPYRFVDEQLKGPYKEWVHTHRFEDREKGCIMTDEVRYRLPLWPLGEAAFPLVRLHLERIFRFRQKVIRKLLVSS